MIARPLRSRYWWIRSRICSGSTRSAIAVDPTRSTNITVSWRRSPALAVMAGGLLRRLHEVDRVAHVLAVAVDDPTLVDDRPLPGVVGQRSHRHARQRTPRASRRAPRARTSRADRRLRSRRPSRSPGNDSHRSWSGRRVTSSRTGNGDGVRTAGFTGMRGMFRSPSQPSQRSPRRWRTRARSARTRSRPTR